MKKSLVSVYDFEDILASLSSALVLYADTESTGLRVHHGDRPFSLIIGDGETVFYFNFLEYEDLGEEFTLDPSYWPLLQGLFSREGLTWVFHNVKFDLGMLRAEGVEVKGKLHCTMTVERIVDSEAQPGKFGLDAVAKKYGSHKEDKVKAYIMKNRLFTERKAPGSDKTVKDLHFNQVPFEMIYDYACQDVEALVAIYRGQRKALAQLTETTPPGLPSVGAVYAEEMDLLKTVFEIEWRGVKCDRHFCREAMREFQAKERRLQDEFEALTGHVYLDSGKLFKEVFKSDKLRWKYGEETATGQINPTFDADILETFSNPAAKIVLGIRGASSDYNFYAGFIDSMDPNDFIHTNLNQHGTTTGRFSSSAPNLQNMTKSEGEELLETFVVRRAIVPRNPGNAIHSIDYKSMEYVVTLDYASRFLKGDKGVLPLLELVKAGHDIHQAMADRVGISRRDAKTVNFALIFGSGDGTLGRSLKSTTQRAKQLRNTIFDLYPEIETLIEKTKLSAITRGFVVTWKGRRNKISDSQFAYRAINYLIQGGSADVVKTAMNRVEKYLAPFETKMVLMIHDELVIDGPPHEAHIVVPEVCKIMCEAFPGRYLSLTVDVEHSFKSLADKEKGIALWKN